MRLTARTLAFVLVTIPWASASAHANHRHPELILRAPAEAAAALASTYGLEVVDRSTSPILETLARSGVTAAIVEQSTSPILEDNGSLYVLNQSTSPILEQSTSPILEGIAAAVGMGALDVTATRSPAGRSARQSVR